MRDDTIMIYGDGRILWKRRLFAKIKARKLRDIVRNQPGRRTLEKLSIKKAFIFR